MPWRFQPITKQHDLSLWASDHHCRLVAGRGIASVKKYSQLFLADVTSLSVQDQAPAPALHSGKTRHIICPQFVQPSHLLLCRCEPLLMFLKPLMPGQMLIYSCTARSFFRAGAWKQQRGLLTANSAFHHPQCAVLLRGVDLYAMSQHTKVTCGVYPSAQE